MKQFPDLPPIWALGMLALSWLLARFVPLVSFSAPVWLAVVLIVLGFALVIWTRTWFRRKATPMLPREVPSALIVEGPFRINRNPIYSGMTLIVLGAALWFGGLSGFLPVIAFPVIITRRFVLDEEASLLKAFGTQAEEYFSKCRRW